MRQVAFSTIRPTMTYQDDCLMLAMHLSPTTQIRSDDLYWRLCLPEQALINQLHADAP